MHLFSGGKAARGNHVHPLPCDAASDGPLPLCALFVRGPAVTALDLDAPSAAALIDQCLIVGGEPALIQVHANDAQPTSLTVVRSTLVCGNTLLNVRQEAPSDHRPALRWRGWDSLLSRSSIQSGGVMVAAPGGDGVDDTGIQWQATNCLYAGWQNLLTGSKTIAGTDRNGWQAHWHRAGGDGAAADSWPAFSEDSSTLPASAYRTAETPVGFAATVAADQPLGCDLGALPPTRENEAAMAFDGFIRPPLEPINDAAAPKYRRPPTIFITEAHLISACWKAIPSRISERIFAIYNRGNCWRRASCCCFPGRANIASLPSI